MNARFVCFVTVAVVVLGATAGVSTGQSQWKGGLKIGVNSAQFRGDPVSRWVYNPADQYYLNGNVHDPITGVVVGGYFRREFGERYGVQLEALYSQKGGEGTVWGQFRVSAADSPNSATYEGEVNGSLRLRMDYIEVPVLWLFRFPTANRVGFTVELGPSFAYNVRSEAQLTGRATIPLPNGSNRVADVDTEIPITGGINRWEVAGVIGAALEFTMSKSIIVVDGRYTFGVTSIDSGTSDIYNHVLSFSVAFMAPLKTD